MIEFSKWINFPTLFLIILNPWNKSWSLLLCCSFEIVTDWFLPSFETYLNIFAGISVAVEFPWIFYVYMGSWMTVSFQSDSLETGRQRCTTMSILRSHAVCAVSGAFWGFAFSLCVVGRGLPFVKYYLYCLLPHTLPPLNPIPCSGNPKSPHVARPAHSIQTPCQANIFQPSSICCPSHTSVGTWEKRAVWYRGYAGAWVYILALPLPGETWRKALCLSMPQCPHLENRHIIVRWVLITPKLHICRFHYWIRFFVTPKHINFHDHSCTLVEWGKCELSEMHVPSYGQARWHSAPCFSSPVLSRRSFCRTFRVSHSGAVCWWSWGAEALPLLVRTRRL